MRLEQVISEATAFDRGDKFESDQQVREYFQVGEQMEMFGGDAVIDQDVLDEWAAAVIENRWHYEVRGCEAEFVAELRRLGATESEIEELSDTDMNGVIDEAVLAHQRLSFLRGDPGLEA